jgi:ParB-like chromosome segregation protein Spo0J
MTDLVWRTEQRKIQDLIPFEGNPRQMTDQQAIQLKASLQKFNIVEIPACNTNGKILAGHQRLKIMQLLGRGAETIDCRVPNRLLTPEEEKEYLLRSNKNTGEWNWDELANFDEEILKEVGFSKEELEKGFGFSLKEEKDEVPEPPKEARTKKRSTKQR